MSNEFIDNRNSTLKNEDQLINASTSAVNVAQLSEYLDPTEQNLDAYLVPDKVWLINMTHYQVELNAMG